MIWLPGLSIGSEADESADDDELENLRAEMWWRAGQQFAEGDIALHHKDPALRDQLCAQTYDFRGKRIIMTASKEIKKVFGRSLDRGTA